MRLSIKALAVALSLLWAGLIFCVGIVHIGFPSYGIEFLKVVSSIYPGFDGDGTAGDLALGTVYGLLDGAIAGVVLAWLYNIVAVRFSAAGAGGQKTGEVTRMHAA